MEFDVQQFLKDLEIIVNVDSGQGNPEGITEVNKFFEDRLKKAGYITEMVDLGDKTGKCLVVKNRLAENYDVMLVGHVDTVFDKGETQRRQFRMDDKRAYGVGVIDMKQGALQMLYILENLPLEVREKLSILAIFNPDEEIGSVYSRGLIVEYAKITKFGFVFEASSTDGCRVIERKGNLVATVKFHGKAGHAGYILDGVSASAIHELIYWSKKINKLCDRQTNTSVNIGKISGGERSNIVADFAEMDFEVRFSQTKEYDKLKKLLDELKEHALENRIVVEFIERHNTNPMVASEETKKYVKYLKELAQSNGMEFKTKARGGVSDANSISALDVVCIDGLAPTGDFDHSEKEYLEISTIKPNLDFSYLMICNLVNYLGK